MKKDNVDPRIQQLNIDKQRLIKNYKFTNNFDNDKAIPIGLGGSSLVYKVHQQLDASRNITVPRAIKLFIMRHDLIPDDDETFFLPAQDNYLEEIGNIAQLSHENLVQVIDAGQDQFEHETEFKNVPYLVTQLVIGCTLRDVIEKKPIANFALELIKLHPEIVVQLISQIGNALGYLHNREYLHCDIAPKNIFIENLASQTSLRAIVGDLGMSRNLSGNPDELLFIAGTKSYSPKEAFDNFDKKLPRFEVRKLFPHWDLYGFIKTCNQLLVFTKLESNATWLSAAIKKTEQMLLEINNIKSASEITQAIEYCLPINRERGGVPELMPSAIGTRKRMMPIEGLTLTKRIDKLIRHPAISRLQNVPQLTIVYTASPGGNHTRYEHSLGVMENVRRMLSSLLDEETFLGILSKNSIETGLLCAILYNTSRVPFSNIIHELNKRLPPGQNKIFQEFNKTGMLSDLLSDQFLSYQGLNLADQIKKDFSHLDIDNIKNILTSNSASNFTNQDDAVIYALLNSSLDARVIDFVRRDSLHLGLSSGDFFEIDDLLPHLTILSSTEGKIMSRVCLRTSGITVAEQIILMRYWLYQRVYWNQPNRAYNAAIRRALLDLQKIPSFEKELRSEILKFDEREMIRFLIDFAHDKNLIDTKNLLEFIYGDEKILYKQIFERNIRQCEADPDRQDKEKIQILISPTMSYQTMRDYEINLSKWLLENNHVISSDKKNQAPILLLDVPYEPGNIKLGGDIFVIVNKNHIYSNISSNKNLQTLDKVSPLIAGVNDNFKNDLQRLRIFIRPDIHLDKSLINQLYDKLLSYITD